MKTELLILSHQLSLLQFFTKTAVYVVTLGQQAAWILKKWQNWQELERHLYSKIWQDMDILERIYRRNTKQGQNEFWTFKLCLNPGSYFSAIQIVLPAKLSLVSITNSLWAWELSLDFSIIHLKHFRETFCLLLCCLMPSPSFQAHTPYPASHRPYTGLEGILWMQYATLIGKGRNLQKYTVPSLTCAL